MWSSEQGLSPRYFHLVYHTLSNADGESGFMKLLNAAWQNLPLPADTDGIPPELETLIELVEFGRKTLTPPLQTLIRPGASNWPIKWLDFRTETAGKRDHFSSASFKSNQVLNAGKIAKPNNSDPKPLSLFITFKKGLSEEDGYVRINNPIFTLNGAPPKNQEEVDKHKVESLLSLIHI